MEAIWAGSSSFSSGNTPYGFYDSDTEFSGSGNHSVDKFADWAAKRLGYPIVEVELQDKQFYACYEEAITEYSAQVNQFNIRDNMLALQGQETGSSVSMGKLLIASNNYSQVMNTPGATDAEKEAAQQELVSALKVVQARAKEQGFSNSLTEMDLESDAFQDLIVKRGLLSAGQLRLAYAAAAADGQTGTSLSDKDVINFLEQLGFNDKNAKLVGKKLTGFVVNRLQNFDSREFRDLANNSRTHTPANIQRVNNYLVGTLGVSRGDLATIADPSKSQEEKDKAVSNVFERIANTSRGTAFSDFVYDKENGRIRYKPVLERLRGRERIYNEYMNKIFPHYEITEDEINLVGERETDPLQTGRGSQTPAGTLQIRIRTPS